MNTAQPGRYTFKVDASRDDKYGLTGIGIVMQYSTHPRRPGAIFDTIAEWSYDVPPHLSEKYAILRALEIAHERGYQRVIVRSDYNTMRKQIKQDIEQDTGWERDAIHTQVLQQIQHFDEFHIRYQPRRKNQDAHKLARKAVENGRTFSLLRSKQS